MPNWCENHLVVSGDTAAVGDFLAKNTLEGDGHRLSFNLMVPMPTEMNEGERWYEWRVENWGTKWDVREDRDPSLTVRQTDGGRSTVAFDFGTAWSPPLEWFEQVGPRFPKLDLDLFYDEPGVGFAGYRKFVKGQVGPWWHGESQSYVECAASGCDNGCDGPRPWDERFGDDLGPQYCEEHELESAVAAQERLDREQETPEEEQ